MFPHCKGTLAVAAAVLSVVVGAEAATIDGVQPLAWYKADVGLYTSAGGNTVSAANGDIIGRWNDQSGNNYHLRRNTGNSANLPTLQTTGGPADKPTVSFDGTKSQSLILSSDGGGSTKQYLPDGQTIGSIFIVFKPISPISSTSSSSTLVNLEGTSNKFAGVYLGDTTGLLTNEVITVKSKNVAVGAAGGNIAYGWTTASGTVASTSWTYLVANYNPTGRSGGTPSYDIQTSLSGSVLTNGWSGAISTGPIADYDSDTGTGKQKLSIQLGAADGTSYFSGQISEVILFDHALNSTEMKTVTDYLGAKYVPEPASAALTFLGGTMLMLRRRAS